MAASVGLKAGDVIAFGHAHEPWVVSRRHCLISRADEWVTRVHRVTANDLNADDAPPSIPLMT